MRALNCILVFVVSCNAPTAEPTLASASSSTLADGLSLDLGIEDWPMYNRDVRGSRFAWPELRLNPRNIDQLGVRWRFPTTAPIWATPVIAGEAVYAGDIGGTFYAVSTSGVERWRTSAGVGFVASSALVQGEVVIVGDNAGTIFGLARSDGHVLWSVKPNPHPFASIWGSAIPIGDDRIAIGIASNEEPATQIPGYQCCTFRGSVAVLNPHSGAVIWHSYLISEAQAAQGSAGSPVWSTPTYDADSGLLYVTTGNDYSDPATPTSDAIIALDSRTGHVRWVNQRTAGDVSTFPPGPDYDFGDSAKIYRLASGRKVVSAGQKDGSFTVVDAGNGALVNSLRVLPGSAVGGFLTGMAHAYNRVYGAGISWPGLFADPTNPFPPTNEGDTLALSEDGHSEQWRFSLPGSANFTGAAVGAGIVYFQSHFTQKLYALDAGDGHQLAAVQIGVSLSGPSISRGRVYVGTGGSPAFPFLLQDNTGSITALGAD